MLDPSTGEPIADVARVGGSAVDHAIDEAARALPRWSATPPRERSAILRTAHELMLAELEPLALLMSLEMGKTRTDARAEVRNAAEFFRWFHNGGQACTAANRFLVHGAVADDLVTLLSARMAALPVTPATDEVTQPGPMINAKRQRDLATRVDTAVGERAKVHTGGIAPARSGFFSPATVLSGVDRGSVLSVDETFGPVAPIIDVADDEDAAAPANSTEYRRRLRLLRGPGRRPVGGRAAAGGHGRGEPRRDLGPGGALRRREAIRAGREGGFEGIHEFLELS